jgi:hypothetical protein
VDGKTPALAIRGLVRATGFEFLTRGRPQRRGKATAGLSRSLYSAQAHNFFLTHWPHASGEVFSARRVVREEWDTQIARNEGIYMSNADVGPAFTEISRFCNYEGYVCGKD